MAPFSMTWTTHTTSFKAMPFFDAEYLINGTIWNTNRELHTPYSSVSATAELFVKTQYSEVKWNKTMNRREWITIEYIKYSSKENE